MTDSVGIQPEVQGRDNLIKETYTQAIRKVHCSEVVIHESIASQLQLGYEERHDRKTKEVYGTMAEEVRLVLPPPVDVKQLTRFTGRTEEMLRSPAEQIVGSRQGGIIITIILNKAIGLTDIMNKLENMPEVEAITEKPLTGETYPILPKKVITIPKLKNRPRITLFVALEKDHTGILSSNQRNKEQAALFIMTPSPVYFT